VGATERGARAWGQAMAFGVTAAKLLHNNLIWVAIFRELISISPKSKSVCDENGIGDWTTESDGAFFDISVVHCVYKRLFSYWLILQFCNFDSRHFSLKSKIQFDCCFQLITQISLVFLFGLPILKLVSGDELLVYYTKVTIFNIIESLENVF